MKRTALLFLSLLIVSACSSQKSESHKQVSTEFQERVRPVASGGTSAAYFTYTNHLNSPDTLLSVEADFAGMAQVHESYETEEGMMGMREQKEIIVKPHQTIEFKQGGLHVMLMAINEDLSVGDSVVVNLNFAQGGLITKRLPILQ